MSANNCNCSPQSTKRVCGDFEIPENPDQGQCHARRVKKDCEAPLRPENPCNDRDAYAEALPGEFPPFVIIATIFDEDCGPILDHNGAPIQGQY
jgi:hypothetical protein